MKIKNLVFDLYGVLFFLRSSVVLRQMGVLNTIKFLVKYGKTPYSKYYEILNKMRLEVPGEFQDSIAYRGNYFPHSFCEWQRGMLTNNEIQEKTLHFLEVLHTQNYFYSFSEYQMFTGLLKQAFDSKSRIPAMKPNRKLIQLIMQLKQQDYKLFMVTNIDLELFENLKQAFPDVFNVFDDVTTSCHTHLVKPQKEIFEYLLHHNQLEPQETIFFDDQQENVDTAQNLGMQGLLYKKGIDITSVLNLC